MLLGPNTSGSGSAAAATNESAARACACFSFCTLHEVSHYIRYVPQTLYEGSPWLTYLRGVYGASFRAPLDGETTVAELARLQLLYTRGLPIARCAPLQGTHVARATIPTLPRRVDPMCPPPQCAPWYPPGGTPIESRGRLRGFEPYFHPAARFPGGHEVLAVRWWARDPPVTFVPSHTWLEVFRWRRAGEGMRFYGMWFVPAAGSGVWLNVGRTRAGVSKDNVSAVLARAYTERIGPLPSSRVVAREGSYPLAFTAHWLGVDSVQTIHHPSLTPELVVCDEGALGASNATNESHLRAANRVGPTRGACGGAPESLRSGQHAEHACTCEPRAAIVVNCAEVAWSWTTADMTAGLGLGAPSDAQRNGQIGNATSASAEG